MPDWKNLDVVERLMAALVAANGCKVSVYSLLTTVALTNSLPHRLIVRPSPVCLTTPTIPSRRGSASTRRLARNSSKRLRLLDVWT
jgi:hypothetical protein